MDRQYGARERHDGSSDHGSYFYMNCYILQAFIKQAYKFGVIYMKENQQTEEELFANETHSKAFDEFLDLLGQRIRLKGFNKYRAGLDGNNDLTGTHSVYTKFADNEIMFHVSTLLPFEEFDSQKVII